MKKVPGILLASSLLALVVAVPALSSLKSFNAHLSGKSQVPARETQANGQAKFEISPDGTQLQFRISTGMIENVTAAQIHVGSATEVGPAVAVLYGPVAPGGGKKSGVLAQGTITAAQLTGPLAGRPLADLVSEMQAGRTYVNVLTDDGQGGADEKPGDFASGEIRGQIR
jgi:hypothetical protein